MMIKINTNLQVLSACIDCYQYISTGELDIELSIAEVSTLLGTIERNWPKRRFKLEPCTPNNPIESDNPCDFCDMILEGSRYFIQATEVH